MRCPYLLLDSQLVSYNLAIREPPLPRGSGGSNGGRATAAIVHVNCEGFFRFCSEIGCPPCKEWTCLIDRTEYRPVSPDWTGNPRICRMTGSKVGIPRAQKNNGEANNMHSELFRNRG